MRLAPLRWQEQVVLTVLLANFLSMYQITTSLNHRGPGPSFGYAVFGRVIQGYEAIESIKSVETKPFNGHRDVPIDPVIIENVSLQK